MFGTSAFVLLTVVASAVGACKPPPPTPPVDTMAWCGAIPGSPAATATVTAFAAHGIDSTFGPCLAHAPGTPAFPGGRYLNPAGYMQLLRLNAEVGMKTVVYDARLWSEDPAVRAAAWSFWSPEAGWIEAWDMGDEFDPSSTEWALLLGRWTTVVSIGTGIEPFTNHLPNDPARYGSAVDRWIVDNPTASRTSISFDTYNVDYAVTHAVWYRDWTDELTCAVNAYDHGGMTPTDAKLRDAMARLEAAGCDRFLVFGGPPLPGVVDFDEASLVTSAGAATSWLITIGQV